GREAAGVREVFDCHGHAVQRAERYGRRIATLRRMAGALRIDLHERRQLLVLPRDPLEMRFDDITRGQLAAGNGARQGRCSEVAHRWIRDHRATMPKLAAKSDWHGHETCFVSPENGRQYHG